MKRAALLLLLAACATADEDRDQSAHPRVDEARSAIVEGTESDDSQNAAVLVMHYDALAAAGGAASGCTGTLLAPTLVMTARHCVSVTDDGAACTATGDAVSGGKIQGDHDPSKIYVFGGKERPDFLAGDIHPSRGTAILTTGATTLCDDDIALLVLDQPVVGATIAPIRLDGGPQKDEVVTVVGWGISEDEDNPKTRRQRTGLTILDVGPHVDLGPAEFRVGEGPCSGDSGGPAFSAQGAVVGALSRGGNGKKNIGADACIGGTNIFTSTAAKADFIRAGYARVNAEPWLEGQPMPAPDAGTPVQPSPGSEPAPPPAGDGCNASSRRTSTRRQTALAACILAVLFARRRQRKRGP